MSIATDANLLRHVVIESCVLGGIAVSLTALRLYFQIRFNGIRGVHWDDRLMIIASIWLVSTLLFNALSVVASNAAVDVATGATYLNSPGAVSGEVPYTAQQAHDIVLAAKFVNVGEESYEATIYLVKICLLIYYNRFTRNLRENRAVKALAAYIAVCFVGTQIAYFVTICRPFSGQWATPPPQENCYTWFTYGIIQGVLNMSSDILIMLVPLPILITSNLPAKEKWSCVAVFSLGAFVIVSSFLTKWFFLHNAYDTSWLFWTMREVCVSVFVANLIRIFPHVLHKAKGMKRSGHYASSTEKTLVSSKFNNRKFSIFSENTDFETKISHLSKGGSVLGRTTLASYRNSSGDRDSSGRQSTIDIEAACMRELPRSILHLAPKRSLEVSPRTSADHVVIPRVLVRDDVRANRRSNGLFCDDYELR